MQVPASVLKDFFEKNNIHWSGYFNINPNSQIYNKANYVSDLIKNKTSSNLVKLYFGEPVETVADAIRLESDENVLSFYISETSLEIVEPNPNTETGFIVKDISKNWLKYLVNNVPNAMALINESCDRTCMESTINMYNKVAEIENQIEQLKNQKAMYQEIAKSTKQRIEGVRAFVTSLENEK